MTAPRCAAFRALAPDLALGILDGDERAAALEHVAGCPACRRELDELTATVDDLLVAAPRAEPPPGFEVRALAGFAGREPTTASSPSTHRPQLRPRRRPVAAAAAAVVLLVAAAVVAVVVGGDTAGPPDRARPAASAEVAGGVLRTPRGAAVGAVRVEHGEAGSRSRLVVSVDAGAPTGSYRVECDYESGRPYTAGQVEVGADGVERWSATVSVPTYDLRRVRLVSAAGDDNLEAEVR